ILTSGPFRARLHRELNHLAERGAERAAPVVVEVIRTISIEDALALIEGGPTAATTYLRRQMGPGLINAMIPGLADAIREVTKLRGEVAFLPTGALANDGKVVDDVRVYR
ncbi:MAG: DUF4197 family protein, partial [Gammaproteobacteria bacterium]